MDSDKGEWAIVFISKVAQEFDSDISCPYLRIFDQERLDFSGVPGFIGTNVLPLLELYGVLVTYADTEALYHTREELIVRKNESVNPNVLL